MICLFEHIGDWYNANVEESEAQALANGVPLQVSDAFTINGLHGDLCNCSQNRMLCTSFYTLHNFLNFIKLMNLS